LTVKSDPKRDPRKHIISLVYLVTVDPDAQPKGGDDATDASFYDLKEILKNKERIAFDHYEILLELVDKKLKNSYI
jgi:8-oxo-dGTP diphosphatase